MTDQLDTIPGTNGSAQLFAKMARVMGKMSRIEKRGYNKSQSYAFATESDVVDMVREAMAEENIALFVDIIEMTPTPRGEKLTHWVGRFVFTFADGETGDTRSCQWVAEAAEYGDKGINKVATAAVKYFLLKTFLISTGDIAEDADSESGESQQQKPAKAKASNGKHTPAPVERPGAPSQNGNHGNHGDNGKTIEFPGKPATPKNAAPAAPESEHQPAMLMLGDLIDSPDLKKLVPQDQHRRALVNLLAKHGLFADCETTPDMMAIVAMYGDERGYGTDKEKSPEDAVAAVKATLKAKHAAPDEMLFPLPTDLAKIGF